MRSVQKIKAITDYVATKTDVMTQLVFEKEKKGSRQEQILLKRSCRDIRIHRENICCHSQGMTYPT